LELIAYPVFSVKPLTDWLSIRLNRKHQQCNTGIRIIEAGQAASEKHNAHQMYQCWLLVFICSKLVRVADADIIFCPVVFSIFYLFSSPNLSGRRVDVYHTSAHGVALVRI